ncbi:MAG TPA: hypothetical protein PK252_11440 [Bacteroidales bacterium]|nr:hypothetical protein [Bacteroidales bacterium]
MKTLYTLIFLAITYTSLFPQDRLLVVKVNGIIIAKNLNKELQTGLEIASNEKFDFKAPTATASLINPKSGKIFQLNVKKNIYMPDIEVFEDRGEGDELLFEFFTDTVVFYKRISVTLPQNLYEKFKNQEYILTLFINAKKVSLPFKQTENSFVLQNGDIVNIQPGQYEAQLCSVKKNDKSSSVLSKFLLIIPDNKSFNNECTVIKKVTTDKANLKRMLFEFIKINYGKIANSDIEEIMNNEQ